MKLGDFVQLSLPKHNGVESRTLGRIVMLERIDSFNGVRKWVYVRWFDSSGDPNADPVKMEPDELEVYESNEQ